MATTLPSRMKLAAAAIGSVCGFSASISIRLVATNSLLSYRARYINRHLVPPERSAQLHALHHRLHLGHHLTRDLHALDARSLGIVGAAHALQEVLGHGHAQLV